MLENYKTIYAGGEGEITEKKSRFIATVRLVEKEEDALAFIEEILKGDVNDKNYQKQIIDHLVSQVFVSDDDTIVYFNIRGGKDIEKMTFDDVKNTNNNIKGVQTQSPLASQEKIIRTP